MATITGNANLIITTPAAGCRISVRSYRNNVVVGQYVIVSDNRTYVADQAGAFSFVLEAGDYAVMFNSVDRFIIRVPEGNGSYNFTALIISETNAPVPITGNPWPVFFAGSNWVLLSNGKLYAKNQTTGKYHEAVVDGEDTAPFVALSTPGVTADPGWFGTPIGRSASRLNVVENMWIRSSNGLYYEITVDQYGQLVLSSPGVITPTS